MKDAPICEDGKAVTKMMSRGIINVPFGCWDHDHILARFL